MESQTSEQPGETLQPTRERTRLSPHGQTRAEVEQCAAAIATELGETNWKAIWVLRRLVYLYGEAWGTEHVAKARAIEDAGGMLVPTGQRRRTFGGVFFFLAKTTLGEEVWTTKVDSSPTRRRSPTPPAEKSSPKVVEPQSSKQSGKQRSNPTQAGEARGVKIRLNWRPGIVEKLDGYVITHCQTARTASVAKGLPLPPTTPTLYRVIIAAKHWARVESALADPTASLVVDGYPQHDATRGAVVIYAVDAKAVLPETPELAAKNLPVGELRPVKVKITGKPGKVDAAGDYVSVTMENSVVPSIPKGVATPAAVKTTYRALVTKRQWVRIEKSVTTNPDDTLVVEGGFVLDPKSGAVLVHAFDVKSVAMEKVAQQAREKIEADARELLAKALARSAG